MKIRTGIGQDSHRFTEKTKKLKLGGVVIPKERGLEGNSDADVVLHGICNAISSVSGKVVLGPVTDELCRSGITDSAIYVKEALKTLRNNQTICHISVSIECKKPAINPHIEKMKKRIAEITGISSDDVGITATTGEGLTEFGRGEGIQAFVCVTVCEE